MKTEVLINIGRDLNMIERILQNKNQKGTHIEKDMMIVKTN
jgi:hypothetical protein